MVDVPVGAVASALRAKVVVHVGEQPVGLEDAVTPAGRLATENVTAWGVPDDTVAVSVFVTPEPCATDLFPSLLRVKSKEEDCVVAATTSMPIMPHQSKGTV